MFSRIDTAKTPFKAESNDMQKDLGDSKRYSNRDVRRSTSGDVHFQQARDALLSKRSDFFDCGPLTPGRCGTVSSLTDNFATNKIPGGSSDALVANKIGSVEFKVGLFENDWFDEPNSVFVSTKVSLNSVYACLQSGSDNAQVVKVLKRDDVDDQTVCISKVMRKNCKLQPGSAVNLSESLNQPAACWDSVTLDIRSVQAVNPRTESDFNNQNKLSKTWSAISQAFLKMCHESGCPLSDSNSYQFSVDDYHFIATVGVESSEGVRELSSGLLVSNASVLRITTSESVKKKLEITDIPPAVNVRKLAEKFDFDGQPYGIGGVNDAIRQFVNSFISPRLLSVGLQDKLKCKISRGGILSGPPGTGKTLFVSVIESLLKENGFSVSTRIISGPEVFGKYVGESEQRVREIFSEPGSGAGESIRLILIDEIDSMLPARGRAGDNGIGDKVVNQFLTCMDGIDKKNNLIVFGTTNRPDLVDSAVMRPGRMDMQMKFNLPEKDQRLQILRIQTRDLSDSKMLNTDVSLEELAEKTSGFSGAELGALVEKARLSALRKGQGLTENDTFFCPQALSQLETLDVSMTDFEWAFTQVQPQFGKRDFMSLAGKTLEYEGYSSKVVEQLKKVLVEFKQDNSRSVLRVLIKGPQGSGKSTLAALAKNEFGAFCSYVSAKDVVKTRDRQRPLNDAFAERNNHQVGSGCNYTVIIDDFDTMINYDGLNYDRGMVSALDAHTKQSLQGQAEGKLLTLVTVTEREEEEVEFLPRLFPSKFVFKTVGK